jgi:uncharacterized protein YgbK (DUF1537 family)
VEEKTGGRCQAEDVGAITLEDLRQGGPEAVTRKLLSLPKNSVCIVNAAALRDLEVFVAGLLEAEAQGRTYLFRTAAQFVAARMGLEPRPLWNPVRLQAGGSIPWLGGLTVVGSYVPKSTRQLEHLLSAERLEKVELPVAELLSPRRDPVVSQVIQRTQQLLEDDRDVVLFTSRQLVTGRNATESLDISRQVSQALVELVQRLEVRPRYFIAKGGITSSDLATRGLGVKRAMILGQILPGVPVWELGPETKYPGLPYVVFPGNVGGPEALRETVQKFRQ